MKLLVLGGTRFVGRAIVEKLLAQDDEVVLFHRGRSGPDLFPTCEHVLGDRDGGLEPLVGRPFDACVDVSGYVPRIVARSLAALRPTVAQYLFVSTVSVYADPAPAEGPDEDAALAVMPRDTEEIAPDTYGALKVFCEREVLAAYPDAAIVRPTIVVGPEDGSDRLHFWARRARRGGRFPVPGRLDQPLQFVHSDDLAAFVAHLTHAKKEGIFNAASEPLTFQDLLTALGANGEPVHGWGPKMRPMFDWPLALPEDGSRDGMFRVRTARARTAGLVTRPLIEIAAEALRTAPEEPPGGTKYGRLDPAVEAGLLS